MLKIDRRRPVISADEGMSIARSFESEHLQTSDAVGEHIGQIFSMAKFHRGFICSAGLSDEKGTPPAYSTNKLNNAECRDAGYERTLERPRHRVASRQGHLPRRQQTIKHRPSQAIYTRILRSGFSYHVWEAEQSSLFVLVASTQAPTV